MIYTVDIRKKEKSRSMMFTRRKQYRYTSSPRRFTDRLERRRGRKAVHD